MKLLQSILVIGLFAEGTMAANPWTDTVHSLSASWSIRQHRGGALSLETKAKTPSLTELKSKTSPLAEKFIENTLYSKENQPESDGQAEWTGFLSGWMLVALPVPLPILVSVLIMNTLILMGSKWDNRVKNKCLIGFAHSVTVLFVLLRELESQISSIQPKVSPRVALMGLNVATTLLFGRAGTYVITKRLMDTAIWATLLYVVIHYFR